MLESHGVRRESAAFGVLCTNFLTDCLLLKEQDFYSMRFEKVAYLRSIGSAFFPCSDCQLSLSGLVVFGVPALPSSSGRSGLLLLISLTECSCHK